MPKPTHDIWNPWHGCHKCSPGCMNCYMYALDEMRGVETSSNEVRLTKAMKYPLSKNRQGAFKVQSGERLRVNMTSDTFLEEADEWRTDMWNVIRQRPDVIFWILTKRPERIADHLPDDWGDGWDNVSMNITTENQEMFDKRISILLNLPAKHKGICIAPMIGPVDITTGLASGQLEEVSVGGENYNNPRPCRFEWVQHVARQCRQYQTNFTWYESGTNFWVGNKQRYMPSKREQTMVAFCAALNQHYYDPTYVLRDPKDGHVLVFEEQKKKTYNLNHCLLCANQYICNGCSGCGTCGDVKMVDAEYFHAYEADLIRNHRAALSKYMI